MFYHFYHIFITISLYIFLSCLQKWLAAFEQCPRAQALFPTLNHTNSGIEIAVCNMQKLLT